MLRWIQNTKAALWVSSVALLAGCAAPVAPGLQGAQPAAAVQSSPAPQTQKVAAKAVAPKSEPQGLEFADGLVQAFGVFTGRH